MVEIFIFTIICVSEKKMPYAILKGEHCINGVNILITMRFLLPIYMY